MPLFYLAAAALGGWYFFFREEESCYDELPPVQRELVTALMNNPLRTSIDIERVAGILDESGFPASAACVRAMP
jgi:hypothetical protein